MSGADVLTPADRDELVEHVRAAARDASPLVITGGTTRPPHAVPGVRVVSTRRLDRIVAHAVGDLTLTAECGLTLGTARATLEAHRQFLALDADVGAEATLGGVIATGRDGPLASRFGSVRDQVLGITVVNGDGRVTHAGGRVVKNVTGYDLCRLYAGSRGGLGVILEVTLRVRPRPERARRIAVACDGTGDALAHAMTIRDAVPEAASIQLIPGIDGRAVVHVIVAGLPAFVEAACADVRSASGATDVSEVECDAVDFTIAAAPPNGVVVEIAALPCAWRTLEADVTALLTAPLGMKHDVLRGIRVSWHAAGASPFLDATRLDAVLVKAGAVLDVPSDPQFPASLARCFPGQVPNGIALMKALKAALDPRAILNRGLTVYG